MSWEVGDGMLWRKGWTEGRIRLSFVILRLWRVESSGLSVCERFVGVAKCRVLLSCYDFPVFWCMWKVAYVGVVVDEYVGLLFVWGDCLLLGDRCMWCLWVWFCYASEYLGNFLAVIFMVEIVCNVCPVLCLLLFYFSTYLLIEWLDSAKWFFCMG